ncbi:hypothetical protein MBRA1_001736 [Malassezia brasiliensis]|uniref:Uncharacterized protein n=1 Tax=Malassezia brasiliensis TaxID=1821822 RepID=A0AAF0DTC1_9BASI|nr:hypothetical protein MBRA1_001736 [Malassezia brasiliensis]
MSAEVELFTTSILGNPIPFVFYDLASDDEAKRRWRRKARDPRIPGLLVRNEWVGSYEEFEEAVEYGELRQFLGVDTVAAPQPKPEMTVQSVGSGRERIPPAPTLMAIPAVASKTAYAEDADYMLSELLPQGTTISDADVDSLLKELEKPLKRTPRRTYTPSSRATQLSVSSSSNKSASSTEYARYEPGTRNLVEEAARAIGVEPKPRGPAPRIKLNRRPLQEILEERRARQAETENARRNDELFASLGLTDAQISNEDAEAFLRDGTIPEVQRKKTSSVSEAASIPQQPETNLRKASEPGDANQTQALDPAMTSSPVPDERKEGGFTAPDAGASEVKATDSPDATKDTALADEAAEPGPAVKEQTSSGAADVLEKSSEASATEDAPVSARKSLQERLRKTVHLAVNPAAPPGEADENAARGISRSADMPDDKQDETNAALSKDANEERVCDSIDISSATDAHDLVHVTESVPEATAVSRGLDEARDKSVSVESDANAKADISPKPSLAEETPDAVDESVKHVQLPEAEGAESAQERNDPAAEVEQGKASQELLPDSTGEEPSSQAPDQASMGTAGPTSSTELDTALQQGTIQLSDPAGDDLSSQIEHNRAMTVVEKERGESSLSPELEISKSDANDTLDDATRDANQDEVSPGSLSVNDAEHENEHVQDSVDERTDPSADQRVTQSEAASELPVAPTEESNRTANELIKSFDDVNLGESPALEEPLGTQMLAEEPGMEPSTANVQNVVSSDAQGIEDTSLDGTSQSSPLDHGLDEKLMPMEHHTLEQPLSSTDLAEEADLPQSDAEMQPAEGQTSASLASKMAELDVPVDHTRHTLEGPLSDAQLSKSDKGAVQVDHNDREVQQRSSEQSLVGGAEESLPEQTGDAVRPAQETVMEVAQNTPLPLSPENALSPAINSTATMPSQDESSLEDKTGKEVMSSEITSQSADAAIPAVSKVDTETAGTNEVSDLTEVPDKADVLQPNETESVSQSPQVDSADSPNEEQQTPEAVQEHSVGASTSPAATSSLAAVGADGSLPQTEPTRSTRADSSAQDVTEKPVSQGAVVPAVSRAMETETPFSSVEPSVSSEATADDLALSKADPTPSTYASTASTHHTSHTHFHQGHTHWNNEQDLDEAVLTAPRGPQATHLDDSATFDHFAASDGHVRDRLRGIQRSDSFQHGLRHLGHGATKEQERVALHQMLDRFSALEPPLQADPAVPRSTQTAASTDVSRHPLEQTLDAGASTRDANASASDLPEETRRAVEQLPHHASPSSDRRRVSTDASPEEERVAVHQVVDRFSALEPPLHVTASPQSPQPRAPDARHVSADASAEEERIAVHQVVDRFSGLEPPLHAMSSPRSSQPDEPDARHVPAGGSTEEERIAEHQVRDRFSALEPPLHADLGGEESSVTDRTPLAQDPLESARTAQHQGVDCSTALEPPQPESSDEPGDAPSSAAHPTSLSTGNEPESSEGEDDDDVPDLWVSNPSRASQALSRHSGVDSDWDAQASDVSGSVDEAVRVPVDLDKLGAAQRPDERDDVHPPESPSVHQSASSRTPDESESDYSQDEESADNTPEQIVLSDAPAPLTAPPRSQDAEGTTSSVDTLPERDTNTPKLEREAPASAATAGGLSGASPSTPTRSALAAKSSPPLTPQHAGDAPPMAASTDTPTTGSVRGTTTSKAPAEVSSPATVSGPTAAKCDAHLDAPPMPRTPSSEPRDMPNREADVPGTTPRRLPTSPQATSTHSPRSNASPSLRSLRTPTRRTPEIRNIAAVG